MASGYLGLIDLLSMAKAALEARLGEATSFTVMGASRDGRAVLDGHGRLMRVDSSLADIEDCAALFVPGFFPSARPQSPRMSTFDSEADWVSQQHARGALVGASCSGAYLLGHAKLLDHRRCTTTWWLHDELKRQYPLAQAVWGRGLVDDRGVVTAGSPLSWINLALHVIGKLFGAESARIVSNFAVLDAAPSGSATYLSVGQLDATEAFLLQAERAIRHARGVRLGARELAHQLAVSQRTLHRRLAAATGESVKHFIDRVRIEMARASLETENIKVRQVASEAGFDDEASFRRVFKRIVGTTPGAYRDRARLAQAPRQDGVPGRDDDPADFES